MKLLLAAVCGLLLLLNAAPHAESRRHHDSDRRYSKLFVFGDEFVDTGNFPLADLGETTRAWYGPYGMNDVDHGAAASGRFSNGLVLSDLVGKALGHKESPPPESRRGQDGVDASGMNLAVGGAGVVEGTREAPSLRAQIEKFRTMVKHGVIDDDLDHSVALIALSGRRDYARVSDMTSSEIHAMAQDVTDGIADAVERLMELGVKKLLVATLPPIGCTPWLSRPRGYESCDSHVAASAHNAYLDEKVFGHDAVFNLDLHAAFTHLVVDHNSGSRAQKFKHKLEPCCESDDEAGFCGQMEHGMAQYAVCTKPDKYFYWDEINPTQAGWEAVMDEVRESIQNFLGIDDDKVKIERDN